MASQKVISFAYDANLEVVTKDHQKLALASSGMVALNRPDKIHATRSGGFADVEMLFDAKTLTMLRKTSSTLGGHSFVSTAEAVVGRPVTPVSVAGVARRTARRN